MNHKKVIVVGIILLGILALFITLDYKKKGGLGGQIMSPNILYLTSPVNSLSGKVEKIEGNSVLISNQYTAPQTAPIAITVMPNQPPVMPTPQVKTITYKLLVTDKTQISQPASNVDYLFKTVTPAPISKFTIKDIKVGQMVTVNSNADLRTLKNNEFEAIEINLPPIANTLNGAIVSVANNVLILKAFAPTTATTSEVAPSEKEYAINIIQDTEISRMTSEEPPKPEKLSLADLKTNMQAVVYTSEDVTETQTLTALRIEPAASTLPSIAP